MEREERIGMNEAVFRDVNERIQDVAEAFKAKPAGTPRSRLLWRRICLCSDKIPSRKSKE